MRQPGHLAGLAAAAVAAALMGSQGCSDSAGLTTPTALPRSGAVGAAVGTAALASDVVAALDRTLQDEYHAESLYLGVLADHGDQAPFANVVRAEERHSESIAHLYTNHGRVPPASLWTTDNVPHFSTLASACAAAVDAERGNVALYDAYLGGELPADVRMVFENNRRASLEHHLPAFESCSCQTCPVR